LNFLNSLEQKPGAPLGLVYPYFDQAGGGDIVVFFADFVRRPEIFR
jgi:hypothetical protein